MRAMRTPGTKPIHEQGWVAALLARETPFTAGYAGQRRAAEGLDGSNYGPDVVCRLRNCPHLVVEAAGYEAPDDGMGPNRKLYTVRLRKPGKETTSGS